jgi:hypothetical protein
MLGFSQSLRLSLMRPLRFQGGAKSEHSNLHDLETAEAQRSQRQTQRGRYWSVWLSVRREPVSGTALL